ncbi:hypothetical protein [Octadecabacter antarcticus]|nr:hypothetical protein [Octadecabacter antarcticus]
MKELIVEVQKQVEGYEHYYKLRTRARRAVDQATFERILEAIICDLCVCVLQPEFDAIHLPLSNKVLRKQSRYKGVALGKTLPDTLHILTAEETLFVGLKTGTSKFKISDEMMNVAFAGGVQTTVWAEHKLLSRIERFGISYEDIKQDLGEEAIILREPKERPDQRAKAQEYKDTPDTLALRGQLTDINTWLGEADLHCDLPEVNTQDRYLRRIFNNSDFAQGGRLYGGFWQRMSTQDRQEHIMIDGECVVELDYGQMSLSILYGLAGTKPPEGDLYDLSADGISTDYRKGIKIVAQAVINSSKVPTRMPKGVRKHLPARYSIRDILAAIKRKHPTIYPQMTSGIGMQLFRKESDILVDVLETLRSEGIVALPVHDAVFVRDNNSDKAKAVMKKVFEDHTSITPDVTLG